MIEERKDESDLFFDNQISFRQSPELEFTQEGPENDLIDSGNVESLNLQARDKTPIRPSGLLGSVEKDEAYILSKKYYNVVKCKNLILV